MYVALCKEKSLSNKIGDGYTLVSISIAPKTAWHAVTARITQGYSVSRGVPVYSPAFTSIPCARPTEGWRWWGWDDLGAGLLQWFTRPQSVANHQIQHYLNKIIMIL